MSRRRVGDDGEMFQITRALRPALPGLLLQLVEGLEMKHAFERE